MAPTGKKKEAGADRGVERDTAVQADRSPKRRKGVAAPSSSSSTTSSSKDGQGPDPKKKKANSGSGRPKKKNKKEKADDDEEEEEKKTRKEPLLLKGSQVFRKTAVSSRPTSAPQRGGQNCSKKNKSGKPLKGKTTR